jgi:2-hydroxy-3-keto-5-methylthiopentenyl-1-phosphate phosphatase
MLKNSNISLKHNYDSFYKQIVNNNISYVVITGGLKNVVTTLFNRLSGMTGNES